MLINNPQHPSSFLLQAHLALETLCPFRLIRRWTRLPVTIRMVTCKFPTHMAYVIAEPCIGNKGLSVR